MPEDQIGPIEISRPVEGHHRRMPHGRRIERLDENRHNAHPQGVFPDVLREHTAHRDAVRKDREGKPPNDAQFALLRKNARAQMIGQHRQHGD